MSHGDRVVKVPEGFSVAATSGRNSIVAAMADEARHYYGLQFHPEVAHTKNGRAILARFVKNICRARAEWTMPNFAQRAVHDIRTQTQGEGVLLGLSGGVDSSVAAALLHRAVGDQLHCVLVDHGLMRADEVAQVRDVFVNHFGVDLTVVDAAERFFAALRGIADPEKKRKVIGAQFVKEFQAAAKKFSKKVHWLAQGTIYPDVVESAAVADGGKAVIKSHHNVGGLPRRLQLKLLEPLRELFKDEVAGVRADPGAAANAGDAAAVSGAGAGGAGAGRGLGGAGGDCAAGGYGVYGGVGAERLGLVSQHRRLRCCCRCGRWG